MKQLLYIFISTVLALGAACLVSCQSDDDLATVPTGSVVLKLSCGQVPTVASRAGVDADLSLVITRTDGKAIVDGRTALEYAAGSVPAKIDLPIGSYVLHAYTNNQTTWATAQNGLGEACHDGRTEFTVHEDEIVYCTYRVPMTNYAVALSLPETFETLFPTYTLTLSSGSRRVMLKAGQMAYFAPNAGFNYALSATNSDGKTSSHSPQSCNDVEAGKCYTLNYSYGLDASGSNVRIDVADAE